MNLEAITVARGPASVGGGGGGGGGTVGSRTPAHSVIADADGGLWRGMGVDSVVASRSSTPGRDIGAGFGPRSAPRATTATAPPTDVADGPSSLRSGVQDTAALAAARHATLPLPPAVVRWHGAASVRPPVQQSTSMSSAPSSPTSSLLGESVPRPSLASMPSVRPRHPATIPGAVSADSLTGSASAGGVSTYAPSATAASTAAADGAVDTAVAALSQPVADAVPAFDHSRFPVHGDRDTALSAAAGSTAFTGSALAARSAGMDDDMWTAWKRSIASAAGTDRYAIVDGVYRRS
jgi:hypothetical protein